MTIGERIAGYRKAAGLTQAQLAAMVGGIHPTMITQIERGTKGVSIQTGIAIAKALDCDIIELILGREYLEQRKAAGQDG